MMNRAFGESGRPYSGGGGHTSGLYDAIRAKGQAMASKVRGMAEGVGSGGASSGYSTDNSYAQQQRQYARQGRRMDRASEDYWDEVNNPDPQKATGWARRNLGKNRGTYPALLTDPIYVATNGMGLDAQAQHGTFDWFESLPVADLAMIQGGTSRKGLTRKTKPVKVPHILRDSIDPVKPEFKRELDYSKYATQVRDIYRGLSGQGQPVLNQESLMSDLAGARNKGALRQGIQMQAEYDPGGAIDRAQGYFDSVFRATRPDYIADVQSAMANRYMSELNMASRKPKHIDRAVRQVARRFEY
jgi:hypothetical protein